MQLSARSLCLGFEHSLGECPSSSCPACCSEFHSLSKYVWSLWSSHWGQADHTAGPLSGRRARLAVGDGPHSFPADLARYADRHSSPLLSSLPNGSFEFSSGELCTGQGCLSAEEAGLLPGLAGSSLPSKRPTVRWGGAAWCWGFACFPLLGLLRQSIF